MDNFEAPLRRQTLIIQVSKPFTLLSMLMHHPPAATAARAAAPQQLNTT